MSCQDYFNELYVMTEPSLHFLSLVMLVRKYSEQFVTNLQFSAKNVTIVTSTQNKMKVPAHSSSFYENGPYYITTFEDHSLPDNLKNINNIKASRRNTVAYAKSIYFYEFRFW